MGRKAGTTRRSVSVKGITYQRMKNYAEQTVRSVSNITEEFVNEKLDALGVRTFTAEEAEALRPKNTGEPPLKHPDTRANDQVKKAKKVKKAKAAVVESAPSESRSFAPASTKEPTELLAPPSDEPPRGGGVHSF